MNASTNRWGIFTATAAALLAFTYAFGDGPATAPDPPDPGAPACDFCACVEVYYWWNSGDASTQQTRYQLQGNTFVQVTYAQTSIYSTFCSTDPRNPCLTAKKWIPSHTKRVCTGAPSGPLEKLVAVLSDNEDTEGTVTYQRYICGTCPP
jgi:hypothetical protein